MSWNWRGEKGEFVDWIMPLPCTPSLIEVLGYYSSDSILDLLVCKLTDVELPAPKSRRSRRARNEFRESLKVASGMPDLRVLYGLYSREKLS